MSLSEKKTKQIPYNYDALCRSIQKDSIRVDATLRQFFFFYMENSKMLVIQRWIK